MKRYELQVERDEKNHRWVVDMEFTLDQVVSFLGGGQAVAVIQVGDDEFQFNFGRIK